MRFKDEEEEGRRNLGPVTSKLRSERYIGEDELAAEGPHRGVRGIIPPPPPPGSIDRSFSLTIFIGASHLSIPIKISIAWPKLITNQREPRRDAAPSIPQSTDLLL